MKNADTSFENFRSFCRAARDNGMNHQPDIREANRHLRAENKPVTHTDLILVIDPNPDLDPYDVFVSNVEENWDGTPILHAYDTNRFDLDDGTYSRICDFPGVLTLTDTDRLRYNAGYETVTEFETRTGESVIDRMVFPEDL